VLADADLAVAKGNVGFWLKNDFKGICLIDYSKSCTLER